MTGQVKEDIIARWGELGIQVREGSIHFNPVLLRRQEFLSAPGEFHFVDVHGEKHREHLEKDTLAFTYCQVPVVYRMSAKREIVVRMKDGPAHRIPGQNLGTEFSMKLFNRSGDIERLEVWLAPGL